MAIPANSISTAAATGLDKKMIRTWQPEKLARAERGGTWRETADGERKRL